MSQAPRVYADFNNVDETGAVRLIGQRSLTELRLIADDLEEGLRILFYDDEFESEGVLDRSSEDATIWVGRIRWEGPSSRS